MLLPLLGRAALRPAPLRAWCWAAGGHPRALGTHPRKEPIEALNTAQGARDFIYSLHATERSCLLRELHRFESIAIAQGRLQPADNGRQCCAPGSDPQKRGLRKIFSLTGASVITWVMMKILGTPYYASEPMLPKEKLEAAPPSSGQLKHVGFHNALPFVGFGFLDNAIMIVAGTHIELSIGIILGISTMAAAALGNLVSDLAGLGLAGYVEALSSRLGLPIPDLTPKQADMWQTRLSAHLGKAIGVTIGCLLGMFPLFFLKGDEEGKSEKKQ